MKIDRNNYEVFFIDYFEGNLNREEKEELQVFLSHNPDLKDEFDTFETIDTGQNTGEFKFKNDLKKQIGDLGPVNKDNIDEYSVAYLENDLTETEKTELLDAIKKNAGLEKIFNLYQQIKFEPDQNRYYDEKKQIKHFVIERRTVIRAVGFAAAAAVLLLGVFRFIPEISMQNNQSVVSQNQTTQELIDSAITEKKVTSDNDVQIAKTEESNIVKSQNPVKKKPSSKEKKESIAFNNSTMVADNRPSIEIERLEPRKITSVDIESNEGFDIKTNKAKLYQIAENKTNVMDVGRKDQKIQNIVIPENRKLDIWSVAEIGIKVFNRLNETNFDVKPKYTDSGKLESVTLITEQRKITAPAI